MLLIAVASPARARLLTPVTGGRTSLVGVDGVQKLGLDRGELARLGASEHALVRDFPLGRARTVDLVLERFEPFAPEARAEVVERDGPRHLPLPDQRYFRGTVAGEAGSLVVLIAAPSRAHGFVVSDGEVFPFGPDARGGHRIYALGGADPTIHRPPGDFCANDLHPEAVRVPSAELAGMPVIAETAGALKQADVAIETDRELRTKFTSDAAALDYLASLAAAASAIYERDVAVRLRFSYIRLWGASPDDPWTATGTSAALSELRGYWNDPANDMAHVAGPRTVVHFVSGKSVQGGIAYINVLCNQGYGYGVSQVNGHFDLSQPSQIWDVVVLTHELGHNFGSPHSHCYDPPVDRCYASESGCYNGPVVASRGTIMSYCHLLAGGLGNIDLLFGDVVSARIGQSVATASCLATVSTSTTTTSTTTTSTTTTTSSSTTTRPSTTSTTATTSSTTTRPPTTSTSTTSSTTSTSTTTRPTTTSSTTTRPPTTSTTSTTSTQPSTTSSTSSTTTVPTTTSTTTAPSSTTTTLPVAGDADGDGVDDARDLCPSTPRGELVDENGCSLCPCGGSSSHAAYVRCVRQAVAATTLDRSRQLRTVDLARRSSCGRRSLTQCCVFATTLDAKGKCRVMRQAACATRAAGSRALDLGAGSCDPLACAR